MEHVGALKCTRSARGQEGSTAIRLDQLLAGVELVGSKGRLAGVTVDRISFDVDDASANSLHFCLRGMHVDGHDLAGRALASGAPALVCERPLDLDIPQAIVREGQARPVMARLAAVLAGNPAEHLDVVGVTGTNGKTSVTHMVASVLEAFGQPTLVVGTLGGSRTTPEAPVLQPLLAAHLRAGGKAAALEVSSHALVAHRVDAMRFAVAVFTNLSQDHLDFHGDMEHYFLAKAELFRPERAGFAVINADDPWGRRLLEDVLPSRGLRGEGFSLTEAADARFGPGGASFVWEGRRVRLRSGGRVSVVNALAAAHATRALGVPLDAIAEGLSASEVVPGRLEPIDAGQDFKVLVDYAHTPAALEEALAAARAELGPGGRMTVVFGCGGDRDRGKRPLMGAVAAAGADIVVLTSDNPRSEEPLSIIADIVDGMSGAQMVVVEPDRKDAITSALGRARPGDVVLIAGKGHERYQEFSDSTILFDDRGLALSVLEAKGAQG